MEVWSTLELIPWTERGGRGREATIAPLWRAGQEAREAYYTRGNNSDLWLPTITRHCFPPIKQEMPCLRGRSPTARLGNLTNSIPIDSSILQSRAMRDKEIYWMWWSNDHPRCYVRVSHLIASWTESSPTNVFFRGTMGHCFLVSSK